MVGTCTSRIAALVDRRAEAGEVADHAAADRDDDVAALAPGRGERAQHALGARAIVLCSSPGGIVTIALVALERLRSAPTFSSVTTKRRPSRGRKKPRPDQAAADEHRVVARRAAAHTSRVPAGASPSARSAGSARRSASRSAGGSTASATDS